MTGCSGAPTDDLDIVLAGDVADAARLVARAARAACRSRCRMISAPGGSSRVTTAGRSISVRCAAVRYRADLGLRDFTVNAMAEPLDGGELVDPLGGAADLGAPGDCVWPGRAPSPTIRCACCGSPPGGRVGLEPEAGAPPTRPAATRGLAGVAAERVFAELRRVLAAEACSRRDRCLRDLGVTEVILPELHALRGVEQNRFHHRDVFGHTVEVLGGVVALQRDPARCWARACRSGHRAAG